jgi:hypothetical protein
MHGVAEIEMLDHGEGVGRVVVHIVPIRDLLRAPRTPPVTGNDGVALFKEGEHLHIPVVRAQPPTMGEHDWLGSYRTQPL